MFKKRIWLGIILSIILLAFSISGFTDYYKYTQESGDNFYVGIGDKADALEDTNELRQILDDLGNLLGHSKRDNSYPEDGTTGGTITITILVLTNDLISDHTYSGEIDSQPVGESVVLGDLLYFNWAKVTGTDIAFVDGGAGEDTITQVAAKFLEIGLVAGDVITVSGSTSNDGNYTIITVVAGTINVVTGSLTAEGAGASVTITSPYEWKKADADSSNTVPGLRIALETKANGETCLMLVKGYIRDDSAFEFTGAMVYASGTPGAMSSTAPTETGDQIQRVGVAKSADILFFDPSIDVGEI